MSSAATGLEKRREVAIPPILLPSHGARTNSKIAERFEHVLTVAEIIGDFVTVVLAVYVAHWGNSLANMITRRNSAEAGLIAVACGVLCVLMLDREGAYRSGSSLLRVRETERIIRVCVQIYFIAAALIIFTQWQLSFRSLNISAALMCGALIAEKQLLYSVVRLLHKRGKGLHKVVIVGAGVTGRRVFNTLTRSPKLGLRPIAFFDNDPELHGRHVYESAYRRGSAVTVRSDRLTASVLKEIGADMVIVAIPSLAREAFFHLLSLAVEAGAKFAFVPNHHMPSDLWTEYDEVDGLLLTSFGHRPRRRAYDFAKRCVDFVLSLILLVVTLPLSLTIILVVRLSSEGTAIFRQKRVGQDGRIFELLKFRTMYTDACGYEYSPEQCDDPRITPIGRFLRRTSLDELPQILNVLRGEMSLVGPRPEMPFIVDQYQSLHRQRLQVKPGITGLWQLSADRAFRIHENLEYDLYYIRNRNFFMDIAILLHTSLFAMRGI